MSSYNLGRVALIPKGVYSDTSQYEKLDIVSFNNSSYVAKQSVTGVEPLQGEDSEYWMLLVGGGSSGGGIDVDAELQSVYTTSKTAIRNAIIQKGVSVPDTDG